jgi:tripartite-type tricarboxylate transporter receptor subunit TctC
LKKTVLIAAAAALAGAALAVSAQQYPAKTVKIIAPVQPGGGVDLTRARSPSSSPSRWGSPSSSRTSPAAAA